MNRLYPLLSDGLISTLEDILKHNESKIASELLEAQRLIDSYNSIGMFTVAYVKETKDAIERRINELVTDEVRALSIRRDVFEISFTPKGKELHYSSEGTWSRENRQTGKPGRVIKKLMKFEYKEKDIEIFNNLLKSHMICSGEFKIVSGSDITRYYNEDMYYKCTGTLGNSCMRYDECEDYFAVYEDHAKMLICLRNDLIVGRAIIWEIDDQTFMDRIYTCEDYLEESFINYAKENGWYIREDNSLLHSGDNQIWLGPNDEVIDRNLQIKLKTHYDLMPYMDSFRYFNPNNNTINTFDSYGQISLDNTDGTYEGYPYACDCCGTVFTSYDEDEMPDELRWSDYEEQYLCEDCRVYCDGIYDYVNERTNVTDVYTNRGRLLFPEDLVIDESVNIYDIHAIGSDRFVKIDGEWYTCNYSRITTNNKEFIIKNGD